MIPMDLSVVINTKNMAGTLGNALESVKDFADEVVVVDMSSTDDTVKIAKKYGAKIFPYEKDFGFADPARNFALSKATGSWVFVLDADEELSPGLKKLIQQIIAGDVNEQLLADCYFIPRRNEIFGKWLSNTGWWPDYQLRFFKKGMANWTEKVHTAPITKGKVAYLPAEMDLALLHHNYQSVSQFLERLNRYTDLESLEQYASHKPETQFSADSITESFRSEFFRRFFVQKGFEDGIQGLSLSFLQAIYQMVAVLKQWEQEGFPESGKEHSEQNVAALQKFQQELGYWMADWRVRHTSGPMKVFWQLRRKFKV